MVTVVIAVVNTTRLNYPSMQRLAVSTVAPALVAVVCLGFMNPASAAPKKGASHGRQSVALAPAQADGKVSKAQLDGIDRSLASHAGASAEVVGTKALDKRVRGSFAGDVRQCKGDGGCLSKLARAARIDMVLVPVAKPENDGTGVVVTVATQSEVRRVSFVFVTSADLNAAVTANSATLFTATPAPVAAEEPALESLAALPLEPLEPTPAPAPPPPVEKPKVAAKPTPPPPPPAVIVETVPPLEPAPAAVTRTMPSDRTPSRIGWKTYVGAGAAVVGAAAITYGIVQYLDHKSIVDDANGNTTLTQREAAALDDDAQSAYDRSRLGLYVGVPLVVIGAALFTWDIAFDGDDAKNAALTDRHLRLSVVPDARGGAAGAMAFSW